jgi:predicted permease
MLEGLRHDLRDALRALRKQPVFTLVVTITLGLGIGANTAIFSVVNSVLLRPLSYHKPQQLYLIHEIIPQWAKSYPLLEANLTDFRIWQKESQSFDGIAIAESVSMILTGAPDVVQVRSTRASANFLELLGVQPALGRLFLPEEDQPGQGKVVILTDPFWRSRFNADARIIGRSILLDGTPHTVVGVLPQSFRLPGGMNGFSRTTQFFTPLNGPKAYEQDLIGEFDFTAIGRLKAAVTPEQAVAELNVIQARIVKQSHNENIDLRAAISPLQSEIVGPARRGLILLLAAVGALLLMICVNLANLHLSRVPGRLRDAGIRQALGATRTRLIRHRLVESLLLGVVGGALGILLAHSGVRWFAHLPVNIPRLGEASLDFRAITFAVVVSLMTAVLFGSLPAWLVSRADLRETLASSRNSATESRRTRTMRTTLVGLEVTMCTVLLTVAGLLGRSLLHLLRLDPGFSVEHILTADIDLPPMAYKEAPSREAFYRSVIDDTRRLPSVLSAAWISILPLEGEGSVSGINLPGHRLSPQEAPIVNYRAVSADYFQTMGIPFLGGRAFTANDRGRRVVIASQALAHRLWPEQNAVGQQCFAEWGSLQLQPSEVVGVVGDIRTRLDRPPVYTVYVADSWAETPPSAPASASIVVRTALDPARLSNGLRATIHRAGADVPIVALRPMSQLVALNVEGRRFQASLTASFAGSALLLASLGIFGVLAYSVEQRRREFAIRVALGAQHGRLLGMVMRQGLLPAVVGLTVGIAVSFMSGGLLRNLVVGVSASDLVTLGSVAAVIMLVAIVACYIPARRALSMDPIVALQSE